MTLTHTPPYTTAHLSTTLTQTLPISSIIHTLLPYFIRPTIIPSLYTDPPLSHPHSPTTSIPKTHWHTLLTSTIISILPSQPHNLHTPPTLYPNAHALSPLPAPHPTPSASALPNNSNPVTTTSTPTPLKAHPPVPPSLTPSGNVSAHQVGLQKGRALPWISTKLQPNVCS